MEFEFINSLVEEKKDDNPDGTFVGVHLSKKSKDALAEAAAKMKVPNKLRRDKMHATLIYSRKYLPEFKAKGKFDEPLTATPDKLEIFPSQDGNSNVLVVRLDAPDLVKRHKEIMKEHGATYDFDEYKPHITLSYNVGDFDPDAHDIKEHMDDPTIEIVDEYQEDLDLDWAKK